MGEIDLDEIAEQALCDDDCGHCSGAIDRYEYRLKPCDLLTRIAELEGDLREAILAHARVGAELDAALEECDGYRNDLTMLRLRRGGYDRAVANLRDGDRFALWVAAQPFDQDLANDEPSRQQLADYLDSMKETDR